MTLLTRARSLMRNVARRGRVEDDLDAELRSARDLLADEKMHAGLTREEAVRAASIELGGLPQISERVREAKAGAELHRLLRDVRHAIRLLFRRKLFALTAVLSLAIAIGAATATYSWVAHVLLWPPAGTTDGDELVAIYLGGDRGNEVSANILAIPHFRELEEGQNVFSCVGGSFPFYGALRVGVTAVEASTAFVTGHYFSCLGVQMAMGRGIQPQDDVAGGAPVAVISHRLWQQNFGGSPGIIGRTIDLSGATFAVVGVTGPDFEGTQYTTYGPPDVLVPVNGWVAMYGPARLNARGGRSRQLHTFARLRPGVDIRAAGAALDTLAPRLSYVPQDPEQIQAAHVLPLSRTRIRPIFLEPISGLLRLLFIVSLLILAAACINVANFLISYGVMRRMEIGTRLALGATRRQVLQQLLTECGVLGAVSGALGILLAFGFSRLLEQYPPTFGLTSIAFPATINAKALLFCVAVTCAATVAFGLVPALWLSLERPLAAAREGEAKWATASRRVTPRHVLLAVQVALSVMIAIVAALYMSSLANINAVPQAFAEDSMLLARVNPQLLPRPQREAFYHDLFDRVAQHGSVAAVTAAVNPPLAAGSAAVTVPESPDPVPSDLVSGAAGYFSTLGIPLIAGREFEASDGSRPVVLVNAPLAERLWPGQPVENAVGKTVQMPNLPPAGARFEVIGIADQPRCQDMLRSGHPCVFRHVATGHSGAIVLHVRTKSDPLAFVPELRRIIGSLSEGVALDHISTLEGHMSKLRSGPRIAALMTTWLALLTCGLTLVGCIALLWSLINEARRELAIRLALGSSSDRLVRDVMLRVMAPYAVGIAAGAAGAWMLAPRLADQLFQTKPTEPMAYVIPVALLLLMGTAASYGPARLATRTDPSALLRC